MAQVTSTTETVEHITIELTQDEAQMLRDFIGPLSRGRVGEILQSASDHCSGSHITSTDELLGEIYAELRKIPGIE